MMKLYHTPISFNSRRVWIALIEKNLDFELVEIHLDGDHLEPEFVAMNPFHRIPVLVDDDFTVVESLAILDYLEAKYPEPAMLPKDAKDLAIVKMVELVTVNELAPTLYPLISEVMGWGIPEPQAIEKAKEKVDSVLTFFEGLLDDRAFFGSNTLTYAECVAGTVVPLLSWVDVSIDGYPKIQAWCDRLMSRPSWQQTLFTPADLVAFASRRQNFLAQSQA
ncbi:MAG: glutathione S-transferase family protein [Oscillatoriales cyanobacterium]|nr:MAG: glutathione S-transferase family protein [Oscillatoriales cyanobacterium]TAE99601.1 MAG: glutathione S-transferase family protein [Oscillatoriales cyanobacterium]TAF62864.1 MAG: glutathione S-transferase family protein [Oscillatoriales cyanobacterium]